MKLLVTHANEDLCVDGQLYVVPDHEGTTLEDEALQFKILDALGLLFGFDIDEDGEEFEFKFETLDAFRVQNPISMNSETSMTVIICGGYAWTTIQIVDDNDIQVLDLK